MKPTIQYTNQHMLNLLDLKKLSKSQLIELILKQNKPTRPTPAPRKNVKQMIQDYEDHIILPCTP
jgi:hypothetical protein